MLASGELLAGGQTTALILQYLQVTYSLLCQAEETEVTVKASELNVLNYPCSGLGFTHNLSPRYISCQETHVEQFCSSVTTTAFPHIQCS